MKTVVLVLALLLETGAVLAQQSQPPGQSNSTTAAPAKTPVPAKEADKPKPRRRLVADLSGFEISDPTKSKQRALLGATRGGPSRWPVLLAPRLAKFYGKSALFAWDYSGQNNTFEFLLCDDQDRDLLRQKMSTEVFSPDGSALKLEPGKTYYWGTQVVASSGQDDFPQPAAFVVISDAERKQIDQELSAIDRSDPYRAEQQNAQVLVNHRLWYDSIGAYTDMIRRYPDRAELFEQRGAIYAQIDATKALSDADFARADQLRATHPQN